MEPDILYGIALLLLVVLHLMLKRRVWANKKDTSRKLFNLRRALQHELEEMREEVQEQLPDAALTLPQLIHDVDEEEFEANTDPLPGPDVPTHQRWPDPGTKLVGWYLGQVYVAEVLEEASGKLVLLIRRGSNEGHIAGTMSGAAAKATEDVRLKEEPDRPYPRYNGWLFWRIPSVDPSERMHKLFHLLIQR